MKPAPHTIFASELAALFDSQTDFALFDVREAGEAEQGHIAGTTFLPRRLLEFRIAELVPNTKTKIVLCDDGVDDGRAALAWETLDGFGYDDVTILDGGVKAWVALGHSLIEGSNVPSKLFGERLLSSEKIPEMTADELAAWTQAGREIIIGDVRTPDEHALAHIPGAHPAPSFDFARSIGDLERASVPIVVHCAGRTRSIIAAQTLRDLGLKDVYALKNGTMGWILSGRELDRSGGAPAVTPTPESVALFESRASTLAERSGIDGIDAEELVAMLQDRSSGSRNIYLFDVRPLADYLVGHIPGAVALPGGQAVQRADDFVAVKRAPIVFADDREGRAILTALWFRRMGYPNATYLNGGINAWTDAGRTLEIGRGRPKPLGADKARRSHPQLTVETAREKLAQDSRVLILNVDNSRNFSSAHLAGSLWVPRGSLERAIPVIEPDRQRSIMVTCRDGQQSIFAAETLVAMGYTNTSSLDGGMARWQRAGLPIETGGVDEQVANDLVLPPYARGKEGMKRYLDWEEKLVKEGHTRA